MINLIALDLATLSTPKNKIENENYEKMMKLLGNTPKKIEFMNISKLPSEAKKCLFRGKNFSHKVGNCER